MDAQKTFDEVADLLEAWACYQAVPPQQQYGICNNLLEKFLELNSIALVSAAVQTWPEYTKNVSYPVPHQDRSPEAAYLERELIDKWNGPYGEARRRLCQHIADWIRANPHSADLFLE